MVQRQKKHLLRPEQVLVLSEAERRCLIQWDGFTPTTPSSVTSRWWTPKFTCRSTHVKPNPGHCSTGVLGSLIFDLSYETALKPRARAGMNKNCSLWPRSPTTSFSRKEKSGNSRTSWNQHCSEYTEEYPKQSAHIHTW